MYIAYCDIMANLSGLCVCTYVYRSKSLQSSLQSEITHLQQQIQTNNKLVTELKLNISQEIAKIRVAESDTNASASNVGCSYEDEDVYSTTSYTANTSPHSKYSQQYDDRSVSTRASTYDSVKANEEKRLYHIKLSYDNFIKSKSDELNQLRDKQQHQKQTHDMELRKRTEDMKVCCV